MEKLKNENVKWKKTMDNNYSICTNSGSEPGNGLDSGNSAPS